MKESIRIFINEYGIVGILLVLLVFFSLMTIENQTLTGREAGEYLANEVVDNFDKGSLVLFTSGSIEDRELGDALIQALATFPGFDLHVVHEGPPASRTHLEKALDQSQPPIAILASHKASRWFLIDDLPKLFPDLSNVPVISVPTYAGSNFLKRENLLNVADQITVFAIIAIGMTMVIISGAIDLSVGSLVALSAVVITFLTKEYLGGANATTWGLTLAGAIAILLCGLVGFLSGIFVTRFRIPSFIVTLSMMLIVSGLAFTISQGQSIYQVPESFAWLGRGRFLGVPLSVIIMILLYVLAHFAMSRFVFGRYVYAIGGNREASRLSGVPINKILIIVFTIGGLLAGLGGVILASQLNSGSPTYGLTYELYVIAAVVVGGTSLMGGEGKIWGTLIGAFIIGVIQNGMNLIGVESYTQKIVLGLLILVALILDNLRHKGAS